MDAQREIRKLKAWNALYVSLLVVAGAWYGMQQWLLEPLATPKVRIVEPGRARISSMSDAPFVVTHLVTGPVDSESEKRWAALPEPAASIDSSGVEVDLAGLEWRDLRGEPADAPDGPLHALYIRVRRAGPDAP